MEVEVIYAAVELWFAIAFALSALSVRHTATIEDLFWKVPHYYVALPWAIASMATISGLVLYYFDIPICARFRWVGSVISAGLWFVMFTRGAFWVQEPPYTTIAFYFFGAIWQPRIMYSAYRRQRLRRPLG